MRLLRHGKPIYYGWYIAVVLGITTTASFGVLYYAYSVFITPMEAELGWTRGEITGAFSLSLLITGLVGVPVGHWLDRRGARLLMTVGSVGATVAILLLSQVNSLPELIAIMALKGVCGAAVLYEPAFAVIATWFYARRGVAMTIVTFIAGFASTIFIPLSDALLVALGWRQAVFILGILLGVITIPLHGLVLRRRPTDLGLNPDGHAASASRASTPSVDLRTVFRSRYFWLLTLSFALVSLNVSAVRFHILPLLISVDIHPSSAAVASGAIGVMQVVGRMIFAPIERRFSTKAMVAGVFIVLTVSLPILLLGATPGLIIAFVALFGMGLGMKTLARPMIIADSYGAAYYGRISSALGILVTLASTIAPFAAGLLFDAFGSYDWMLALATLFSLVALVLIVLLPKQGPGWR